MAELDGEGGRSPCSSPRSDDAMADMDSRAGLGYGTREILDWLAAVHAPHDVALARAFDAPERRGLPAIQLGPSEAKTLELLLKLAGGEGSPKSGRSPATRRSAPRARCPKTGISSRSNTTPRTPRRAREHRGCGPPRDHHGSRRPALEVLPRLDVKARSTPSSSTRTRRTTIATGAGRPRTRARAVSSWVTTRFSSGGCSRIRPRRRAAMRRFHEEARAHFDTVLCRRPTDCCWASGCDGRLIRRSRVSYAFRGS